MTCPRCDRPTCDVPRLLAEVRDLPPTLRLARIVELDAANDECARHAVDWRAHALALKAQIERALRSALGITPPPTP